MGYVYDDEDNAPMIGGVAYKTCRDVCCFRNVCKAEPHPFRIPFDCDLYDCYQDKMADEETEGN
jgi:hypothetical protein